MPYFPPERETELPQSAEELADWLMDAHVEGIKKGRKQGAAEIVDRVNDWVRKKYFDKDVERGSQYAQDILKLAETLVHELVHGDLGKVPETRPVREFERPKRRGE